MPLKKNASSEVAKLGDHEMLSRFGLIHSCPASTTPGAVVLPATSRGRYVW
jgi:hypothetical protein